MFIGTPTWLFTDVFLVFESGLPSKSLVSFSFKTSALSSTSLLPKLKVIPSSFSSSNASSMTTLGRVGDEGALKFQSKEDWDEFFCTRGLCPFAGETY